MFPDRMTEEGGLSMGRRPRLLSGRVGFLAKVLFSQITYFLISLNYLLNIL